jgi:hypothetical protein
MSLVLHRWHLGASGAGDAVAECRRLVDGPVRRVFGDSRVVGAAECLYAGKYYGPPDNLDEVQLTLVGHRRPAVLAAELIQGHLTGVRIKEHLGPLLGDALCRDRSAWYRQRLTEVTRIALDLHPNPAHQPAIKRLWDEQNSAGFDAYFSTHSPTYQLVFNTDAARTAFWRDFWTWGPEPQLTFPGHWVENLVLA